MFIKDKLRLLRNVLFGGVALLILSTSFNRFSPAAAIAHPRLIILLVIDGLRPDSITPEVMPNLARLKAEGTFYSQSHSVFPTVTRVNAAAISTGTLPNRNGIVANTMFVAGVNDREPFSTGDYRNLRKLAEISGGRLMQSPTLAEVVERAGLRFVALSSGSTGNAFLLNPTAPSGTGVLINGGFEPGTKVAFPEAVNQTILQKFGAVNSDNGFPSVEWTERVLRDYVLPELHPDVLVDWNTEPDTTQHEYGVGSDQALAVLRKVDDQIGLLLSRLRELKLEADTDFIIVSDHGFERNGYGINVSEGLIHAKLKASAGSTDLVVVSEGPSALLYVKNRDDNKIRRTVEYLQSQPWTGVIFTAARPPHARSSRSSYLQSQRSIATQGQKTDGWVKGTFSLELIHEASEGNRAPDILYTLPWSSEKNRFGVTGTNYVNTLKATGPITGEHSGHGSMSPFTITNTMILYGPDFRRASVVRVPSSNVDVMPTILALLGLETGAALDGRPLKEAFREGPEQEQITYQTSIVTTSAGERYRAVLQFSTVGEKRYIDKSWRVK